MPRCWALALALAASACGAEAEHRGCRFFGWEHFADWPESPGANAHERVLTSPVLTVGFKWDELVASWNAETPPGTWIKIEARGLTPPGAGKFWVLGLWSEAPGDTPRQSVPHQKDADGEVRTDTLVLNAPSAAAQMRLTLCTVQEGVWPKVTLAGFVVLDSKASRTPLPPNQAAWGKVLTVPARSQVDYPGGETAWCSPTCVSMVLAYWATQLHRPELDAEVPLVAKGVHDPKWDGAGNWPFNTAFAGARPGLRAYVARLSDVAELEDWIASGVPVIISVAYDILRNKPRREAGDGHLVVGIGFTAEGDVIVNDPGARLGGGRTFPRSALVKAWAESQNTVYLIYPADAQPPKDRFRHWLPSQRGPGR